MRIPLSIGLIAAVASAPAFAIKEDTSSKIGTGAYGAATVGYSNNALKFNTDLIAGSGITSKTFGSLDTGLAAGYMTSFDGFLVGGELEGGLNTGSKTELTNDGTTNIEYRRVGYGDLMSKFGFKFGDAGAYVIGGFRMSSHLIKISRANKSTTSNPGAAVGKSNRAYRGPIIGAGLIYNLISNLSIRGEYKFIPCASTSLHVLRPGLNVRAHMNSMSLGLVYHL